jgi:hypothetical protein
MIFGNQAVFNDQTPGIFVPQKAQPPSFMLILLVLKARRSIIFFPQLGQ